MTFMDALRLDLHGTGVLAIEQREKAFVFPSLAPDGRRAPSPE